jgi:hypothetical protein
MKIVFFVVLLFFFLTGCITRYEAQGVDELRDILVVEGFITDSVTSVILCKSVGLTEKLTDKVYVNNATLYVECDNGAVSKASQFSGRGAYRIETGELYPDRKYRLKIYLDDEEYQSGYLSPLFTPDFDLSWAKNLGGSMVLINVFTHDSLAQSGYYCWSYKEDWEFTARVLADSFCVDGEWVEHNIRLPDNRYYCWQKDSSKLFIMKNVNKLSKDVAFNEKLLSMSSGSQRVSSLYHIEVQQNLLRKEAYQYFDNVQSNVQRAGDIFAPVPAEIPGNLKCVSSPEEPVIGYVEVSTTKRKRMYIESRFAYNPYYDSFDTLYQCDPYNFYQYPPIPPPECNNSIRWIWAFVKGIYPWKWFYYRNCVDCLAAGGTKKKPAFWPNDHQ